MYATRFHPYAAPQARAFGAPRVPYAGPGPMRTRPAAAVAVAPAYPRPRFLSTVPAAVPSVSRAALPTYRQMSAAPSPARTLYPRAFASVPVTPRPVATRPITTRAVPLAPRPLTPRAVATRPAVPVLPRPVATPRSIPVATQPTLPKPVIPGVVANPADPNANPKAKLNEWMMKVGHQVPYVTVPTAGGFSSTLELPLEGAGHASIARGFAPSKKLAETACADNAMQILMNFGLLDVLCQPSKSSLKKKAKEEGVTENGTAAKNIDEVKMVCYDVLASFPAQTANELMNQTTALGHQWAIRTIKSALHAMEADGTVVSTLEQTPTGVSKRWSLK